MNAAWWCWWPCWRMDPVSQAWFRSPTSSKNPGFQGDAIVVLLNYTDANHHDNKSFRSF